MLIKKIAPLLLSVIVIFNSCTNESSHEADRVIIGIPSDVETINPLYAFNIAEGNITELLFLSLVRYEWNEELGNLQPKPMLAEKWEWNNDSTKITFYLRDNVYWSDGVKFTADDVIFSFDVYSDPAVQSKLYGTFQEFYTDEENHIDLGKSFEITNAYQFSIKFPEEAKPTLFDIEFPIIAMHAYKDIPRNKFQTTELNFQPISNGPFKLARWDRNQALILESNTQSYLYSPDAIQEIVFKIIPDYSARITQLKKGEIDLMEDLKPEDTEIIKGESNLSIETVKGREYDYIGWNNIDPIKYAEDGTVSPHPLFGSASVRIALTKAVNRQEILEIYLKNYGELAIGPVAPIFKDALNPELQPYLYDPDSAKMLLANEGWADTNNDGILEKGNTEFAFTLNIASGNPRREYAATIFQNNFKSIGIDVKIETMELGTFIDNLYSKSFDAWMIGWYVPIPLELKSYWYSDLELAPLNFASYSSTFADSLMLELEENLSSEDQNKILSELQEVMHKDEPVTFLYWIDNIVAYNKKIRNISITPLGIVHHCWEWEIEN